MKKQAGFTLIELIIVIIILGILAVTAAPKFLNLQGDARLGAAEGVAGSVASAAAIFRGKRLVDTDFTGEGVTTFTADGYPTNAATGIGAAVDLSADWVFSGAVFANVDDPNCTVTYSSAVGSAVVTNEANCLN